MGRLHIKQINAYIASENSAIGVAATNAKIAESNAGALGSLKSTAGAGSTITTSSKSSAGATIPAAISTGSSINAMGQPGVGTSPLSSSVSGNAAASSAPISNGGATTAAESILPQSSAPPPPCANGYSRDEDGLCPPVSNAPTNVFHDAGIAGSDAYHAAIRAGKTPYEAKQAQDAAEIEYRNTHH